MCLPLEFICYQLQQMMFLSLINVKSCINSNQSSVTVPSVRPVCLATSVHDNVIKKPITCRDSIIKRGRKCLCKSTIVKNGNAVNISVNLLTMSVIKVVPFLQVLVLLFVNIFV